MIEIKTENYPRKEIVAVCTCCKTVIKRLPWESYADYRRKKAKAKKDITECPNCRISEKQSPVWKKADNGDYIAKCRTGDFLVWKYGKAYKWRYRKYGNTFADYIGFARTKREAMQMCERHAEWKSCEVAV